MNNIQRITSFSVDHDKLIPGIYISRVDGDITTFDLRTRTPNAGSFMDTCTAHSVEHMFATYVRNSDIADRVIYFGPMGCRKETLAKIIAHDGGMFGAEKKECGNYLDLNLDDAKRECAAYLEILNGKKEITFRYE